MKAMLIFIGFFKKNSFFVFSQWKLFLHYGWFLQNLGKDFIRTNMHTTVYALAVHIF